MNLCSRPEHVQTILAKAPEMVANTSTPIGMEFPYQAKRSGTSDPELVISEVAVNGEGSSMAVEGETRSIRTGKRKATPADPSSAMEEEKGGASSSSENGVKKGKTEAKQSFDITRLSAPSSPKSMRNGCVALAVALAVVDKPCALVGDGEHVKQVDQLMQSTLAFQQHFVCFLAMEYFRLKVDGVASFTSSPTFPRIVNLLPMKDDVGAVQYAELVPLKTQLLSRCVLLLRSLGDTPFGQKMLQAEASQALSITQFSASAPFSIDVVRLFLATEVNQWVQHYKDVKNHEEFDTAAIVKEGDIVFKSTAVGFDNLKKLCKAVVRRGKAMAAIVMIFTNSIPAKRGMIIKPLIDGLKNESTHVFRQACVSGMVRLMSFLAQSKTKTLTLLTGDVVGMATVKVKEAESRREAEVSGSVEEEKKLTSTPEVNVEEPLSRQSGREILQHLCHEFGPNLFSSLDALWSRLAVVNTLTDAATNGINLKVADPVFASIQVLETILPHVEGEALRVQLRTLFPGLVNAVKYPIECVRHAAATCLAKSCSVDTTFTLESVIDNVIPMLDDPTNHIARAGGVHTIHILLTTLQMELLPYLVFLIVPLMGRMSDTDDNVRKEASLAFAAAVRLVPLELGAVSPAGMRDDLKQKRGSARSFLDQLIDGKKIEPYTIPVKINATLRHYQRDGVNWLAFLRKFRLHGILCDDMGLGKTLQSICILGSSIHERRENNERIPSLVVCPSTVVPHWQYEIENFVADHVVQPHQHVGTVQARISESVAMIEKHKDPVIIMSYDTLRNDFDNFLSKYNWNYVILDEGHVIKNSKSKLSHAARSIRCENRLILSGTPIQNNVLELWTLFDFLMPGYLGTEEYFHKTYGRAIATSQAQQFKKVRSSKKHQDENSASAIKARKVQEEGALALESLHKQVLPFLLRRVKEDVLADLPPKIIQDVYCKMSDVQAALYSEIVSRNSVDDIEHTLDRNRLASNPNAKPPMHIFQLLRYLLRLCSHPTLVDSKSHSLHDEVMKKLKFKHSDLVGMETSAKLVALKEVLTGCGVGGDDSSSGVKREDNTERGIVEQGAARNRVLIFAQQKSMLDVIQNELFAKHMPTVTSLRLDGDVKHQDRFAIVQQFNRDPTVDVLLLTTHVGGLGLNLTGANVVIFVEHDWNPTKDLQAMDRAHRIGQKRVVNVYRLITKDTIEERVMGLQKFKTNIANTVITKDNSSLQSMDTGQVLDLFQKSTDAQVEAAAEASQSSDVMDVQGGVHVPHKKAQKKTGLQAVLSQMGELWDESHYEQEYDLNAYMQSASSSASNIGEESSASMKEDA